MRYAADADIAKRQTARLAIYAFRRDADAALFIREFQLGSCFCADIRCLRDIYATTIIPGASLRNKLIDALRTALYVAS